MGKNKFFICLTLGLLACFFVGENALAQPAKPFQSGEKISYSIQKMGLKVGTAVIQFADKTVVDNKEYALVIMTIKALNFYDQEKIFLDPMTYYPLMVQRDLNLWGKVESIEEHYKSDGSIQVLKQAGGKKTQQTLKKTPPVDNIYGFIYRFRRQEDFKPGKSFAMNLPTKNVTIEAQKLTELKIGSRRYKTLYLQSQPSGYKVWFELGENKIPVRIDGAAGIGKTSLVLEEYKDK